MSRGYQVDPLAEHAALTEIAAAVRIWQDAEAAARQLVRRSIDAGTRSQVVADHLHMSRPTLYRWLSEPDD